MTIFAPGNLSRGRGGDASWDQLVTILARAPEGAKASRGGFSLCKFKNNHRLNDNWMGSGLIGLDFDAGGDVDRVMKALGPYQKIVYSTASSTPEAPRARAIVALASLCLRPGHYRRAHRGVIHALCSAYGWDSGEFDVSGSDPARLWYLPTAPKVGTYRIEVTSGRPLILTDFAPEQPPPPPPRKAPPRTTTGEVTHDYRSHALRAAVERLASARPSERHRKLFGLALWLGKLGLDDDQIESALLYAWNAATSGEGRDSEAKRTIRDGIAKGRTA